MDPSSLTEKMTVPALCVPVKDISLISSSRKEVLLAVKGQKPVVEVPADMDPLNASDHRLILFSPGCEVPEDLISKYGPPTTYTLTRGYDSMSYEEVLRKLLAPLDPPLAFATVGHIAHFNLRDEYIPHRELIGRVLLDKNKHLRTVVRKVNSLSNQFRTPELEVIAARPGSETDLVAVVREGGMAFTVDFASVYWNSRLSTERERLLALFREGEVLVDMFAGVGALSCMAARKGLEVHANDLNPKGAECIEMNAQANGVDVNVYCLDARAFVRKLMNQGVFDKACRVHFVMNLPAMALEFLDVFRGLMPGDGEQMFRVHCHCFAKAQPPDEEISARVVEALGSKITFELHEVRNVSPNKRMYCAEFDVPADVLKDSAKRRKCSVE